jgi:hypothetical protein
MLTGGKNDAKKLICEENNATFLSVEGHTGMIVTHERQEKSPQKCGMSATI